MILPWILAAIGVGMLVAFGARALGGIAARVGMPRRWVALALMLLSVALPVALALTSHPAPVPQSRAAARSEQGIATPTASPGATAPAPDHRDRDALLLWAVLSLTLAAVFGASHRRALAELAECPRRDLFGARVVVSPDFGPAAVGLLRAQVVLPVWVLDLPDGEQQLVLRHELEHVRAGDHFLLLAGVVLIVLMPWNPGLWWQLRRLRIGMELDCDARVAPAPRDRPRYAELLLRARGKRPAQRMALAMAPPPSALGERLVALLDRTGPSRRRVVAWSVSALGCAVAVSRVPVPALRPLFADRRGEVGAAIRPAPALAFPSLVAGSPAKPAAPVLSQRGKAAGRIGHPAPYGEPVAASVPVPEQQSGTGAVVAPRQQQPRYDSLVPYVRMAPTTARGVRVSTPADTTTVVTVPAFGVLGGAAQAIRKTQPADSGHHQR